MARKQEVYLHAALLGDVGHCGQQDVDAFLLLQPPNEPKYWHRRVHLDAEVALVYNMHSHQNHYMLHSQV